MANRKEKVEVVTDFLFLGSKITAHGHEIRRQLLLGKKAITDLESVLKSRYYCADRGPDSQRYGLPSGHLWLWELDYEEGRSPKNWCLQTVVLENTPESSLDRKEIKPVNLKENQPWILIGRTDAEAPGFWSSDASSSFFGKAPNVGKDWRQNKRVSEDEMAGWRHQGNGHELGQTLGDGEGQRGLVCCSPWGLKESDMTGQLNNNNNHNPKGLSFPSFPFKYTQKSVSLIYTKKSISVINNSQGLSPSFLPQT